MSSKIVFTGPESSGKTTLSTWTSQTYNLPHVTEYARTYLENLGRTYDYRDLEKIAIGQFALEREPLCENGITVCDTDLLTIKIWSDYLYRKCSPWILKTLQSNLPSHYILCKPDILWTPDPLRENPLDRDDLFLIYQNEIKELGVSYTILSGSLDLRKGAIHELLQSFLS